MKNSFPGYQSRNPSKLWASCTFAFDASALLDLYRMTPKSRDELLRILEKLKDRVWLPHQGALEYLENRSEVVRNGIELRGRISKWTQAITDNFKKEFDRYQKYQWVNADKWLKILSRACEEIERELAKEKWDVEDFESADPIEKKLYEIFSDERLGQPYLNTMKIFRQAENRIQLSIPPGFKDAAQKKDYHRYGDVVLWFQLLDFAKTSKKSVVFVTSDSKEDWWLRQNGKTIGPRPELIQEMHVVADVPFHMYTPATFIEHAAKYLELQAGAAKIKEAAKELRNIETVNAGFVKARSVLSALYPADVLNASLLTSKSPWLMLENQDYVNALWKNEDLLARLYSTLPTAPPHQFAYLDHLNESIRRALNTPIAGLTDTAARFARAMENITHPFGAASTSQSKKVQDELPEAECKEGKSSPTPNPGQPSERPPESKSAQTPVESSGTTESSDEETKT